MFRAVLAIAFLLGPLSVFATQVGATPYKEYKRALVAYYGAVGYHPLMVPEGHSVGDVVDIRSLAVLKSQEDCFPGLEIPEPIEVDMPRVQLLQDRAASFWVKLKATFGAELSAEDTRKVMLNVESPTTSSVSMSALNNSLSDACPELKVLFEGNQFARVFGRRAVVVSSVLEGTVKTVFSYEASADAEAKLQDLAKLLNKAPISLDVLAPEVSLALNLSGRINIRAGDDTLRTLAYRPSSIFRAFLGQASEVEPFDANKTTHLERLDLLSKAWAEADEDVGLLLAPGDAAPAEDTGTGQ